MVGELGSIIKTTDGGQSFTKMESNVQENLNAIEFFDSYLGFCAGENGTFLKANPDGVSWSEKDLGFDFDLNDIGIIQPNDAWVAGDHGALFHSSDKGISWEPQYEDSTVCLNSVFFMDAMNGWAAGRNINHEGVVLKTQNGGGLWVEVSEPDLPAFSVIHFTGSTIGWAVMEFGDVYKSMDGGVTWNFQFPDPQDSAFVKDLFFTDPEHGWAAGVNFSIPVQSSFVMHTADAGNTWEYQEDNSWGGFNGIYFTDPAHGCAVGNTGSITCTGNGGESWIVLSGSYFRPPLYDVFFINEEMGWVCGGNAYPDSSILLKTLDGGTSWTSIEMNDGIFYDVFFTDPLTGWLAGGPKTNNGNSTILHSTDGGLSWETQYLGSNWLIINEIFFLNSEIGWALGGSPQTGPTQESLMLSTQDGGENWTEEYWISDKYLAEICFVDSEHGWIAGHQIILSTSNGGDSWVEQWNGIHSFRELSFFDEEHGWVLGDSLSSDEASDVLMKTSDGGNNWEKQYFNRSLTDICFTSANDGWILCDNGSVLFTIDGGDSWEPMLSCSNDGLYEFFFIDPGKAWAVGENSSILHWDQTNLTKIPFFESSDVNNNLNCFPNPITSTLNVEFYLHATEPVLMELFDVNGKKLELIASDKYPQGINHFDWNASGLSRGIYFVKLQTENGISICKIVKR